MRMLKYFFLDELETKMACNNNRTSRKSICKKKVYFKNGFKEIKWHFLTFYIS